MADEQFERELRVSPAHALRRAPYLSSADRHALASLGHGLAKVVAASGTPITDLSPRGSIPGTSYDLTSGIAPRGIIRVGGGSGGIPQIEAKVPTYNIRPTGDDGQHPTDFKTVQVDTTGYRYA